MDTIRALMEGIATRIGGRDPARRCRRCGEPIDLADAFGLSETVCRACRGERTPPLRLDENERRAA